MNLNIFAFALLLCYTASVQAQSVAQPTTQSQQREQKVPTRTISGFVLEAAGGKPVQGVMVSSHGLKGYSALTDSLGAFTLQLPVSVTSIDVISPDHNLLQVGLKKSDSQSAIYLHSNAFTSHYTQQENVTNDYTMHSFDYSSSVSIEEDIQMKLGGLVKTTLRNGTPGIGGMMMMNGLTSINANVQPLIVIDGIPVEQQYDREMLHQGFYNNILTNINPADIASVSVLRNGTAIYGARGANGVIIINTKRSNSLATRITASISGGVTFEPKNYDMMQASAYRTYASEMLKTTNTTIRDFNFLDISSNNYYAEKYNKNTDWKKDVYHAAFKQNYGINVQGGDDVAQYNLSLGYHSQQSVLENNNMDRLNVRFNSDISLGKKLEVRFDVGFSNITRNLRDDEAPLSYDEGTPSSPSFLALAKAPMLSPYTFAGGKIYTNHLDIEDETYLNEALSGYNNYNWKLGNPLAILEYADAENKNHFENSLLSLSINPRYKFNDYLTLSENFSYWLTNTNEKYYIPLNGMPDYYVKSVAAYRQNEARSLFSKQNSVTSDTRVDWSRRFGANQFHIMGGFRMQWENYKLNNQLGYNTGNDKTPFISSQLLNAQTDGTTEKWNSLTYYAQADYGYRDKYLLQASLAMDGSSKFGLHTAQGLRMCGVSWGVFPGVQAAWVVTNESWAAGLSWLNYLRLSAGYDMSGNDNIPYNTARTYWASTKYMNSSSGLSFAGIGNETIQWETTQRFNVGLESNWLNNRLNVRAGFYHAQTDHLLLLQEMSFLSGLDKTWGNSGSLVNRGFDISVTGKLLATPSWQWEAGVSMGHYKNEIKQLGSDKDYMNTQVAGATIRTEEGRAANLFYGYRTLGVFATTQEAKEANLAVPNTSGSGTTAFQAGDIHYADLNDDHLITDADREIIGDPTPTLWGNVFTSLQYKRLRLDVCFNYSLGGDVYNYMRQQLEAGSRFMNQTTAMARRWQVEGQVTDMPRISFQDPVGNSRFSDRWIEDGSYLRLKNVTLSYDLPLSTTFLQGLQFWVQASNLFTITKYLGSDPEFVSTSAVLGQGIDMGSVAQSRSIMAGIKINL